MRADLDCEGFDHEFKRGFLPQPDPKARLCSSHSFLDELADDIPGLLASKRLRPTIDGLKSVDVSTLQGADLCRAFMTYGFLASAYIHAIGQETVAKIPAGVAVPLYELATRLDLPPILSYKSYILDNWQRRNLAGPIKLENLQTLTTFSGLPDESWFILVHTEIEAEAAPAVNALTPLQDAMVEHDDHIIEQQLATIEQATGEMVQTLRRMSEGTSMDVFYKDFRPYIFLFDSVTYDGVAAFEGKAQVFRGETGAQSSIMPVLDVAFGVPHEQTGMTDHISQMRQYMPRPHRLFIAEIGKRISVRDYLSVGGNPASKDAYNACLDNMAAFRAQHLTWARKYIAEKVKDPRGTGGTPFMKWLSMLVEETRQAKI